MATEADWQRFFNKVSEPDENGCMLWKAYVDKGGYGLFWLSGKRVPSHRFAAGAVGMSPQNVVRHSCYVRLCVNPDHLSIGTQAENVRDMLESGRHVSRSGEDSGVSTLTEIQVLEIRRRHAEGGINYRELSEEYGVDRSNIGYIIRRKNWKHI